MSRKSLIKNIRNYVIKIAEEDFVPLFPDESKDDSSKDKKEKKSNPKPKSSGKKETISKDSLSPDYKSLGKEKLIGQFREQSEIFHKSNAEEDPKSKEEASRAKQKMLEITKLLESIPGDHGLSAIDAENEKKYKKEVFDFKEGVDDAEVLSDLENLVTYIKPVKRPVSTNRNGIKSQVLGYGNNANKKIKEAIKYIESSFDIKNPLISKIKSKYYVVDEFESLNPYFSGDMYLLEGNTINPLKNKNKEISIFGIKVNDYLIFAKNYMKLAKAFVSGVNKFSDFYSNIRKELVFPMYINLIILDRLYNIMSGTVNEYDILGAEVANTRKKSLEKDKAVTSPSYKDESQTSGRSPVFIKSVTPLNAVRTDDNRVFSIDYSMIGSSTDTASFSINLSESARNMSLAEVESEIFGNSQMLILKNPLPGGEGEDTTQAFITLKSNRYLQTSKGQDASIKIVFTSDFMRLLSELKKAEDSSTEILFTMKSEDMNDIIVLSSEKHYDIFKLSSSDTAQTKYKVSVNGKKKNMSIAEIYMARQSGKKVKVLGMYSLSEDVKKWSPKGKK